MLESSLGPGRVRAEATVRMNFDKVNETQERYDPDGQVTRSTQSVNSTSRRPPRPPPPLRCRTTCRTPTPAPAGTGTQEARQEETTNYEISKTVRTLIRDQPQIDRISLAVMVDGTDSDGAGWQAVWQPRSAEELARITTLVKTRHRLRRKARRSGRRGEHALRRRRTGAPTGAARAVRLRGWSRPIVLRLAETGLFGLVGVAGVAAGAAPDGAAADHAGAGRRR